MIQTRFHHILIRLYQEFLVDVIVHLGCILSVSWCHMWEYLQFQPHPVEVYFTVVGCNRVLVLSDAGYYFT